MGHCEALPAASLTGRISQIHRAVRCGTCLHRDCLHKENALLARYLFSQNTLVREVFGADYDQLIEGVYGEHPERMYILAAQSLRLGGWVAEAAQAVERASAINANDRLVLQEIKILHNWAERMA